MCLVILLYQFSEKFMSVVLLIYERCKQLIRGITHDFYLTIDDSSHNLEILFDFGKAFVNWCHSVVFMLGTTKYTICT